MMAAKKRIAKKPAARKPAKKTVKKTVKKLLVKKPVKKTNRSNNVVKKQYVIVLHAGEKKGYWDGTNKDISGFDTSISNAVYFKSNAAAKKLAELIKIRSDYKIGILTVSDKKKQSQTR